MFVIVFLRAKYSGTIASYATLNRRYIIQYWIITSEPSNNNFFPSIELRFELKLFDSAILTLPWPDFPKKSSKNWSILPKKSIFYLIKFIFKMKSLLNLIVLETFSMWNAQILEMFSGSWGKQIFFFVKMWKIRLRKKCYNYGINQKIFIKNLCNKFKATDYVM